MFNKYIRKSWSKQVFWTPVELIPENQETVFETVVPFLDLSSRNTAWCVSFCAKYYF